MEYEFLIAGMIFGLLLGLLIGARAGASYIFKRMEEIERMLDGELYK